MLDTLLLSRIQFAANISFHILFPTITIALGWVLLYFKLRFNRTGEQRWMEAYGFWVKIFALSFAMGASVSKYVEVRNKSSKDIQFDCLRRDSNQECQHFNSNVPFRVSV